MFPANTLILTVDYNSPEELAHYLKELGANKTTYLSYLKGKDKYINKSDFYTLGMCSLCDKLNNKFKRRTRLDILQLMSNEQCVLPK
jgi:serine/threonine protein kinase